MGYLFLGLAFVGAVGPCSFLGQFLFTHGFDMVEFKAQLWQSPVSSFCGLSFAVATLVTLIFIFSEGRRLKMKGLWLPLLASLALGVAAGLPLFLYLRSMSLVKDKSGDDVQALPAPKK